MAGYWTGAHTKHRLRVHLVWIPKYRKRILIGKIAARLKQLPHQACNVNRWMLSEMSVNEDHVHILVQISPRESVTEVVKILKGGTSKIIRSEFPELEEFLWGDSLWADGYFAETVDKVDEEVIRKYIKDQQR
jgi:putative transposase